MPFRASALFRVLRLFFAYFFLARQKKVCRRRHLAPSGRKKEGARGDACPVGIEVQRQPFGCRRGEMEPVERISYTAKCRIFQIWEALNQWARTFGERFWRKARFERRRNTLCISSFSNRSIGAKDPAKVEAHWFSVSHIKCDG